MPQPEPKKETRIPQQSWMEIAGVHKVCNEKSKSSSLTQEVAASSNPNNGDSNSDQKLAQGWTVYDFLEFLTPGDLVS